MTGEPLDFLPDDLDHLERSVEDVRREIRRVKDEAAETGGQSSETWHDNFAFEESQRQLRMLLNQLGGLSRTLERARTVHPPTTPDRAEIGTTVTYRHVGGDIETVTIGSAMVGPRMAALGCVSYLSPLGALLHLAAPGERRSGQVGDRRLDVEILHVAADDRLLDARRGLETESPTDETDKAC